MLYRETPKCPHCGEPIAVGQYLDQSKTPSSQVIYGDTFQGWKYLSHTCKEKEEHNKKIETIRLKYKEKYPIPLEGILKEVTRYLKFSNKMKVDLLK
jgi:hypothetical protein